ncbi:SDR family oxidoreductase [Pantoea ananatis]|jgi:NAD(P)-dependent dehydrogenase (short-subunit alcohol dehydrogenase family)|nr:SDR family oxidoreductase [Pantoea ananatis]
MKMKTWLITGASRGLGLVIARAALENGDNVIATARRPEKLSGLNDIANGKLLVVKLELNDTESVDKAVKAGIEAFGSLNILVNNAGYGQLGFFEEIDAEAVETQIAVNFLGTLNVTRAVLPVMRQAGKGHIINIASIAGVEGFGGSSVYCASKHAMAGWSEGLAHEVADFGIAVTCLYPGRFRTDFLDRSSVRYGSKSIDSYATESLKRIEELDAGNHVQPGDPEKLASVLVQLTNMPAPPIILPLGSDALKVFEKKKEQFDSVIKKYGDLVSSTDY